MSLTFWIGVLAGFLGSCLLFLIGFVIVVDKWYVGSIREDRSIPEEPYFFMEISPGRFEKIARNNHVIFNVKRENYMNIDT